MLYGFIFHIPVQVVWLQNAYSFTKTVEQVLCYTMDCPSVREDNPRALASGISYVQADNP